MKKEVVVSKSNFNAGGTLLFLVILVSVLAPYGCKRSPFDGVEQGKVVYDVTFEAADMNPMMKALLPSEVTTILIRTEPVL
ncbi:MAG: hypothetical protein IPP71_12025 [Bacteroidetes bacterium]|nr:hypothetical protein [Bacteroidota bacterium]